MSVKLDWRNQATSNHVGVLCYSVAFIVSKFCPHFIFHFHFFSVFFLSLCYFLHSLAFSPGMSLKLQQVFLIVFFVSYLFLYHFPYHIQGGKFSTVPFIIPHSFLNFSHPMALGWGKAFNMSYNVYNFFFDLGFFLSLCICCLTLFSLWV